MVFLVYGGLSMRRLTRLLVVIIDDNEHVSHTNKWWGR